MEARDKRVRDFMSKMEKNVVAEENKKQKLLEDNIRRYEEKRNKEEYLEEERRKKKVMDGQNMLRMCLRDQMEERDQRKKFNKDMNNEYVRIFRDKVARD